MKLASIPTAVKVGSAGVIGGGGIAGTGLLINNQIQKSKTISSEQAEIASNKESEEIYKLTETDKKLLNESDATFTWDESFTLDNSKKTVTIKAQTTLKNQENNSWNCTIKGFVKDSETPSLSIDEGSSTFNKSDQLDKLKNKFTVAEHKKSNKDGFIKSCSRNRTDEQRKNTSPLTSEIKVELKKPASDTDTTKYGFQEEDLKKIFSGDWVNPSNL